MPKKKKKFNGKIAFGYKYSVSVLIKFSKLVNTIARNFSTSNCHLIGFFFQIDNLSIYESLRHIFPFTQILVQFDWLLPLYIANLHRISIGSSIYRQSARIYFIVDEKNPSAVAGYNLFYFREEQA